MKKALLFIHALLLCVLCFAQAPQGFNYQGVARNAAGEPVASKTIKVRLSILDKTATGTAIYAETHSPVTNANGLFSTTVGSGTVVTGVFANIDWAEGSKFLKSEIDINGGNNFVTVATTQMMSVPYALYAQTAGKSSVKTMEASDLIFTADRYANDQLMVAYELNSTWKNNIITVMTKSFINGNLVNSSSALSGIQFRDGSSKLGILFVLYPKAGDIISLVSVFQTEDGIIYKKDLTYTIPTTKYYLDFDSDGYGSTEVFTSNKIKYYNILTASSTFATYSFDDGIININQLTNTGGDCCDEPGGCEIDPSIVRPEDIHPGAAEVANGIDDNCDGQRDEGLPVKTWYRDQDGDGYGSSTSIQSAIDLSTQGYALQTGDCFDNNQEYLNVAHDPWTLLYQDYVFNEIGSSSSIHPGASEARNGVDDNCNGQVDEGFARSNWYLDDDRDGYGASNLPIAFTSAVTNLQLFQSPNDDGNSYSLNNIDCNDNNPQINPNVAEIGGNQVDENCDGVIGEGCQTNSECPGGTVCVAGKCQVEVFRPEICNNGIDDDGDGLTDSEDGNCSQCGNGIKENGEGCDDGNTTSSDGCSNVCQVEAGYNCTGSPSVCTPRP